MKMRLATAAQMQALDHEAIVGRGIPSLTLMETAARGVADAALALAGDGKRAVVLCGMGNNGGDGLCAARYLWEAGLEVRVFLLGKREKQTPDNREMERRLLAVGVTTEPYDEAVCEDACNQAAVVIDALFGVGLRRPLSGDFHSATEVMDRVAAPVVAVDIASGVETDTGKILGTAVHCAVTVTFSFAKPGHLVGAGALCTGRLEVIDIGCPTDLLEALETDTFAVTAEDLASWLPRRQRDAHKGDFGRVAIVAGCTGFTGAPVLASRAAVRTGAGLVHLCVPESVYPIVAVKCDEAMPQPCPADEEGRLSAAAAEPVLSCLERCDVGLIGPGLGRSPALTALVFHLLETTDRPVVLDADGINALEGHIDVLDRRQGTSILTPHDGEFARLAGEPVGEDRLGAARRFAAAHSCVLVLKGHRTITALPDGRCFVNTTGNPGMAKGGSGDVLAGMIAALLGQGLPADRAVPGAVWLHGRAGDVCAAQSGEYAMTPSDMIDALRQVMKPY